MKIFFTDDSNGKELFEDAHITVIEGESLDAIKIDLVRRFWEGEEANPDLWRIEEGHFGDCWRKIPEHIDLELCDLRPFTLDQLHISASGTHPGLQGWRWIEPIPDIHVLTWHGPSADV